VSTEASYAMTRQLAAEEGLLVGISSGANLVAALELAKAGPRDSPDAPIFVVIFPDGGERYLSESFWEE
jgi:cysteine synthase